MIGRILCVELALLVLVSAYHQPGGHYDGQSGLSAAAAPQPIYERDSGCPQQFRGLMPYPHDCHRFISCADGRPVIQTCASGTAFNALTRDCDAQSKISCERPGQSPSGRSSRLQQLNGEPKCSPGMNGVQVHPYDCTKYLNCANGQTFVQSCGPGTAFSPTMLVCDHIHKVDCGEDGHGAGESDHGDLRGSTDGLKQCNPGEKFDMHKLICLPIGASSSHTHASSAVRMSDLLCPEGVEGLFVHPFDQTKYLNCKAGKVAVQSCNSGQVFSISKSYCQPKAQTIYTDYVAYIVSEISYEYSMMLTRCPAGTDGLHLYPYDAGKYVRCAGGVMSIISCGENMAYSFSQRACRLTQHMTRGERVKFFSELSFRGSISYTDSQAFQSALTSCPRSLQGKYVYPFLANYFVLCQNGLLQVESCPAGTVYSLSSRGCSSRQQLSSHDFLDYSYISTELSTNSMQDLTTVTCPANAQGYYLHPFDCTKYLNCRDQQTSIESCERGEVFSISQRLCVARDQLVAAYDRVEYLTETQHEFYQGNQETEGRQLHSHAASPSGEVACQPGASGLHPHPFDCTKFLNCANGQTFIQDSGPGTAFSPSLLVCDFKEKVDCGQEHSYPGKSVTNSQTGSVGSSGSDGSVHGGSSGASCTPGARGLFAIPNNPHKYLKCGIGVQPLVEQCNQGEVFDARSSACVPGGDSSGKELVPSAAARFNDLLCLEGVEGLFAHPFDQTKFLNCKAGKIAIQNCIPGHVFSISKNFCQPKAQTSASDYVTYVVSQISHEYSLMLTHCPSGTDGHHLYPYDAGKYVRCAAGGVMSIMSCGENMAYSYTQRSCLPSYQITREERVRFISELGVQSSYNYTNNQALKSALTSCPRSLQEKFAYPFHARYFVLCQNGLLQVESCSAGTVYSISNRGCLSRHQLPPHDYLDYSYINVELPTNLMQDHTTITCPANAQGYYLHPFDCTKYLSCYNQQTAIESCEKGKVFSISQRLCVARDQLVTAYDRVEYLTETQHEFYQETEGRQVNPIGVVACPQGANGLLAHPYDCTKFLSCTNGQTILQECGHGTAFNSAKGVCERADQVDCTGRTSTASAASYHLTCPENVYGLYAHPFDARSYMYCAEGHTSIRQCLSNELFSISRGYCLSAELVSATDRVSSISYAHETNLEQVESVSCPKGAVGYHAYPFDCTKYLSCEAGITFLQNCPNGQHFSLSLRRCQPQEQVQRNDRLYLSSELHVFFEWWQQLLQQGVSVSIMCPQGLIGNYQHPTIPNKYIACVAPHAQALFLDCPAGQVFSVSRRKCVPGTQVPAHDRCDYHAEDSYGWIDLRHDAREPKAYGSSDQYGSGSGIKTTVVRPGDRWSDMNMQRPPGIGFGYENPTQAQPSGWSGQGSSYNQLAPTRNVLYVEGSLQPNRNYPQRPATNTIYQTPLAPMAPATSNVYYAQPVEEAATSSRSDFGRAQKNDWQTPRTPTYPQSSTGQRPLDLDFETEEDTTPRSYQRPRDHFQPSPPPSRASHRPSSNDQPQSSADESNLYGGLQPPRPATPQQSRDLEPPKESSFNPVHMHPNPHAPRPTGQRPLDSDKPIHYGGLQPPRTPPPQSASNPNPYAPRPTGQRPLDLDYNPEEDSQSPSAQPTPHVPANHRPTYRDPRPVEDESNLYGGLQPPARHSPSQTTPLPEISSTPTNLRTFPIYPPVFNATPSHAPNNPHYSPPYAGVAHSRNATWRKVPSPAHDPFNAQEDYDYDETTTQRSGLRPPPFSHEFYNPTQGASPQPSDEALKKAMRLMLHPYFNHSGNAEESLAERAESAIATALRNPSTTKRATTPTTLDDDVDHQLAQPSDEALKKAMRLMLRPYFNHSGSADESLAERTESAIATAISKPPTTPRTTTRTTTPTTARTTTTRTPDDDVELIVAGEQESLDAIDDDSVVPGEVETARTEQTLNPTTYASGFDTTDFQRGTRRVDVDSTTNPTKDSNNWHTRGHNRGFHQRHPNMPDPFDKPQPHYPHHHFHHRHEHSPLYHNRHPNIPNPFAKPIEEQPQPASEEQTEPELEEDPEFWPNPNAEETTPHTPVVIGFRSGFNEPCEFDCGAGKCVKQLEVCDGVNNCGNRRDESQCDHLGYQVRLTGGESPHMGRIEVKVNGQWGYVCDDKFGLRVADVVCHELGYKMGASEVRGNSYYEPPERNFNYAMDELECRGNETKLKDCDFKGWGVHNCGVDEVVGVVCKVPVLKCPNGFWLCKTSKECIPPAFVCDHTADCADKSDESDAVCKAPIEYRLEGGRSPIEGRLEVKYHGVWGSVCDDDFNVKSAQVACNALGYYGLPKIEKNIFGPGSGPIWLDQVQCVGNETSIDKCRHWNWGEHNCNHTEDVGLRCTAGPPPRQARQRTRLQALSKNQTTTGTGSPVTLSDIGLWERSSKALRTPRRCGIFKDDLTDEFAHPEQRVVQGSVAKRGRHPWQATIRTRGRGGISSHWCGAVVISKRHLLTAAHCLYGHPKGAYFVRVGDHYANIAEHSEVDSFIENWYTHEQFRQPTHMNNDIAVVVLKTPLKFNDYVQPICLPERGAPLVENRTCTISGWGSIKSGVSTPSQELRAAQLPILPDNTCKQMNVYGDAMTEGMFCAGSMDESVDACEGDSGGPLVCSDEDGETLYGIISWGQHCGYQNRPGVYVRVCHYIDWIYEKINQSLLRF